MCIFALGALGGAAGAAGGMSGLGLLQMGFSIMGSIMQYQGQMQAYQAEMEYRNEQAIQAQKTLNLQVQQQQLQYESELNKAQQETFNVRRDALKAQAKATNAAAESGITGLSVNNLLGEVAFEEGMFTGEMDYNADVLYRQTVNETKMAERGAQARLASIPIPQKPSFGPTLVNIGSTIVGGLSKSFSPSYGTPGIDGVYS